jgi:hypothetical protein
MTKKSDLDPATQAIVKRVLAMPPKPHEEMKIGRAKKKTKRGPKDRASFAKRRTA